MYFFFHIKSHAADRELREDEKRESFTDFSSRQMSIPTAISKDEVFWRFDFRSSQHSSMFLNACEVTFSMMQRLSNLPQSGFVAVPSLESCSSGIDSLMYFCSLVWTFSPRAFSLVHVSRWGPAFSRVDVPPLVYHASDVGDTLDARGCDH